MSRLEVRVAGFGGQGVITMGYILAKAASVHDGNYALMAQSYGPEARGGACRSDVIISKERIDYPKIEEPDCLIAMSMDAYDTFLEEVKKGGVVIYDIDLISREEVGIRKDISYHGIPAAETASSLGNRMVANIVMLGSTIYITDAASIESVKKAIGERFPKYKEINLKALEKGLDLARE